MYIDEILFSTQLWSSVCTLLALKKLVTVYMGLPCPPLLAGDPPWGQVVSSMPTCRQTHGHIHCQRLGPLVQLYLGPGQNITHTHTYVHSHVAIYEQLLVYIMVRALLANWGKCVLCGIALAEVFAVCISSIIYKTLRCELRMSERGAARVVWCLCVC